MRSFVVVDTAEELASKAAAIIVDTLRNASSTRFVLAGGTTPKRAYGILAGVDLPWGRVSVLFGDERCVPPWHADSNYRMATEVLLGKVHPAAVMRIPAELGPDEAAKLYEPFVAAAPLDLVLLGIGPDGHTASLFPGNPGLEARGYVTAVRDAPKPPPDRVSLTFRALREARRVIVLVAGADKAEAVMLAKAGAVPAAMIENAEWYVSREAAG